MSKLEKLSQKLERAEEVARQLKALKKRAETLERIRAKKSATADDVRRKALIGAIVLKQWQGGVVSTENLMALIGPHIQLPADRLLFTQEKALK